MRKALKWLGRFLLAAAAVLAVLVVQTIRFRPLRLNWFYGKVFAEFALDSPQLLSSLRVLPPWLDFYSGKLDDLSPAHEAKQADVTKADLDTLHRYDRSGLDPEGKLSYDVLDYFLGIQVEGDHFRDHDYLVDQLFGVQLSLPNFMIAQHQITTRHEAERYLQRLDAFSPAFDQLLESLRLREAKGILPPEFMVTEVRKQVADFVDKPVAQNALYSNLKEKLDKLPASELSAADKESLLSRAQKSLETSVVPAYRKLGDFLAEEAPKAKGNFGVWHQPDGDAFYAWCVRFHTTTDLTPEQVHTLGLKEVADVGARMEVILRGQGLTTGTLGDRIQQLAKRPDQLFPNTEEGKQQELARYQAILDEVNAGLGDAFHVRPKLGVQVKPVEKFSEANAPAAYYEPGSFDGTRQGAFFANMRDTTETPKFAMRTLAYHEGIPGHHFQISVAEELSGVPFFRRVLPFTAFDEGWALYAERLAWELGFEKDPLDDLGRLRDEMMRAVRLVVDSGIHYKHWTREQAIAYMLSNTGMAEKEVVSEIERYFVNPGQALAYKVGMLKILELRERAKQQLGPRFKLSEFHDQVLTHGALPLALLERVIDDWIAQTKSKG